MRGIKSAGGRESLAADAPEEFLYSFISMERLKEKSVG